VSSGAEPIRIVAAVVADDEGRVLLVRKRGSTVFIQPGGKREAGEHAGATLARELAEELGVALAPASMRTLGTYEHDAVNEPGRRVRADAYVVQIEGDPQPRAEIEELAWVPPQPPYPVPVAPLSAMRILPAFRALAARS
jgi:8-oxo-dGTP diphosphatase